MEPVLLNQGVELLVYGMGTVILFLSLLVLATRFMSWVVMRFFPQAPEANAVAQSAGAGPAQAQVLDPRLLAAIAAAVQLHRAGRQVESRRLSD